MMANGTWPVKFPGKHSNNFFNGVRIGICIVFIFGSLFWWLWLNKDYWAIRSGLITSGLEVQQVNYILSDMAGLISGCAFAVTLGSVLLIYMALMQFSPTFNSLIRYNKTTIFGSNLVMVGTMLLGWGITDYVSYNYYQTTHYLSSEPIPSNSMLGVILLVAGVLLTVYAYTKSRKAITKV